MSEQTTLKIGEAWRYPVSFDSNEKVVHISVAQRLERERDEAIQERNEFRRGLRLMAQNAEIWKEKAENAEKELQELLQSIRVTDEIQNENYHPQYGGTSLL